MHRLLRIAGLSVLWFGLWLLLVEKFSVGELVVGAGCALVAAVASEVGWGAGLTAFGGHPRHLLQAWRLPAIYATGTVEIFKVLLLHLFTHKKAQSLILSVPFDAGREDDPDATARRALAIAYTTMTPNFVILGIDLEKRTMLYHQVSKSEVPKLTQNLGARP